MTNTTANGKLNDYEGLIRQAEKLELSKDNMVYDEAIKILNTRKGKRLCELTTDMSKVIDLCMMELNETGELDDKDLIIGSLFILETFIEKRNLLKEVLHMKHKQILTPEERLSQKVKETENLYKMHFNYENEFKEKK